MEEKTQSCGRKGARNSKKEMNGGKNYWMIDNEIKNVTEKCLTIVLVNLKVCVLIVRF